MNIRILLILFVGSLLLAATGRWRVVGSTLSVILAALLIWFIANQPAANQDSDSPALGPSTVTQMPRIAPVVTLLLDGNGAPWRLSGTIANPRDTPISSITLNVERLDCPLADSAEDDCNVVWRGQHTLRISIAAAKSTRVDDSFYSHETVPRLKGVARDHITVMDAQ